MKLTYDDALQLSIARGRRRKEKQLRHAENKARHTAQWLRARLRDMGALCPITPEELDKLARPQEI